MKLCSPLRSVYSVQKETKQQEEFVYIVSLGILKTSDNEDLSLSIRISSAKLLLQSVDNHK